MDRTTPNAHRITSVQLGRLFDYLTINGYQNIGPVYRDGAIMLDTLHSIDQLAGGIHEQLSPGKYLIEARQDKTFFQYTTGPQSFKQFLYPPHNRLWSSRKNGTSFDVEEENAQPRPMAFWGVRDCDLRSIRILDRIFLQGTYQNNHYKQARTGLFIIAAGCVAPSHNCFCTTMGGNTAPVFGFDVLLTEVTGKNDPYLLIESGTVAGEHAVSHLHSEIASEDQIKEAHRAVRKAELSMKKRFSATKVATLLKENPEHPHWEKVAGRCLSCANCTLVCPTCFCSSTEDITAITGDHSERWLRWDSCFNGDHSYIHGGQIRPTTKARYRQWLTHKFSSWIDQFDMPGCVGCGRCITWCPAGIDLTEEIVSMKPIEDERH